MAMALWHCKNGTERPLGFIIRYSFCERTSGIKIPEASAYETGRLGIVVLVRIVKEHGTC